MGEITANINWLAVVVGAVLAFLLGWLWYSPSLFGINWAKGVGVSLGDASEMPVKAMVTQAVATFFLAWVVGVFAANSAVPALILVVLTIVLLMASGGFFSKKSDYAIATETGFVVAMAAVMVAVHFIL